MQPRTRGPGGTARAGKPSARPHSAQDVSISGNAGIPGRRAVLWGAAICLVVGGKARAIAPASLPPPPLATVRARLERLLGERIDQARLTRADGYVYAIDVGLLALATALAGDRDRYERLVTRARRELIIDHPPGLDGTAVAWRRRARGGPPDASGTTEALQLAQALLVGGDRFALPQDARLARALLAGYLEHAAVDSGVWIIRNYFNFETRTFATNSFLIDYGPDLLLHVARRTGDADLREAAARSARLVRAAQRQNGLIDTLVQPEIKTLFPFAIFSPNDVIVLQQACLVAEQVVSAAPEVARATLSFVKKRAPLLYASYVGSTGQPYGQERADAGTLAAVMRLAVALDDRDVIEVIRPQLAAHAETLTEQHATFELHVAAQTLLGLESVERWERKEPRPLATAVESSGGR